MTARTRTIIGWTPVVLISLFLVLASGLPKFFMGEGSSIQPFMESLGVWDLRIVYGLLEIACVVLLLIPRTSTVGFVLTVGLLGGALATNITHPEVDTMPILPFSFLLLLTLSAYFRNPELLSRLLGRSIPVSVSGKKSRIGLVVGWICAILVAAFNLFAAISKFMTFPEGSAPAVFAEQVGMKGIEVQLGILQLIIIPLFLIPRTTTIGFVLMIGYTGGILAANLTHGFGTMDIIPIYTMLLLLTVSAYYRNPELLSRLLKKPVPDKV